MQGRNFNLDRVKFHYHFIIISRLIFSSCAVGIIGNVVVDDDGRIEGCCWMLLALPMLKMVD
jgi:hypothetical protein